MKEDENDLSPTPLEKSAGEMREAEIDANLEGTIPASAPAGMDARLGSSSSCYQPGV